MSKVALIWGAAGGIGRALANKLKLDGWEVIAMSRHADDLAGAADYAFAADVADPFSVQRACWPAGRKPARRTSSSMPRAISWPSR